MATIVKNPKMSVAQLQLDANEAAERYVALSQEAAPLEAELKRIRGEQETQRTKLAEMLQNYPALLNGKNSLSLGVATVSLRKAPVTLEFDKAKYTTEALMALLKKHKLEGRCVELKVKQAEVVKACDYIGKLPVELAEIGVSVADASYSLVITTKTKEPVSAEA